MTLKDIGTYKYRLQNALLSSTDICEMLLGENYNIETVGDELLYKNIFPYLYVDDIQTNSETYICFEVDVPRTSSFTLKDMKVIVMCYTNKMDMAYKKKGYLGTKVDIVADAVDRLLNSSNEFGIGRLKLESANYVMPSNHFYGRQLIYSCSEFNLEGKL